MAESEEYVCTLSAEDEQKARDELGEDPKQRLGAVQTLREWVQQQPHIRAPTDTKYLLRFLRVAKFNIEKACSVLYGYLQSMSENPNWFYLPEIDPKLESVYEEGIMVILPGCDKEGRRVILARQGKMDATWSKYSYDDIMRANMATLEYLLQEERFQVNGLVFVSDLTDFSLKHQISISPSTMKKSAMLMQGRFPLRLKDIHYYNSGPIFEAIFSIAKVRMSKKMQDRIIIHKKLDKLYQYIPMEMLPSEYLPEGYLGPNAGTLKELIEQNKRRMTDPEVRARLRQYLNPAYGVDDEDPRKRNLKK